ncbi:hypothetical protein KZ483_15985 [Paenibacillus sp. sptzw28]|uniref:DUF6376 family protein n=1 Tax=Paenibacillus sp. sptzw28 TaxID=715179 RepID=UPI001C6F39FA|nr:DUF6376 family protein [Paenibacillus sp. sptzw28]QYR19425.1 hypothetical protein KZ483_15985 [Paenibacillus sp. sptzw28]
MKSLLATMLLAVPLLLGGCSLLEEVNRSLDYADEASNYVQQLGSYGQDARNLAEQAVSDLDARTNLEQKLTAMKEEASRFTQVQAPEYAQELHAKIADYNSRLNEGIDSVLADIKNGIYNNQTLQNAGVIDVLNQIDETLTQIKELQQ